MYTHGLFRQSCGAGARDENERRETSSTSCAISPPITSNQKKKKLSARSDHFRDVKCAASKLRPYRKHDAILCCRRFFFAFPKMQARVDPTTRRDKKRSKIRPRQLINCEEEIPVCVVAKVQIREQAIRKQSESVNIAIPLTFTTYSTAISTNRYVLGAATHPNEIALNRNLDDASCTESSQRKGKRRGALVNKPRHRARIIYQR